MIALMDCNNFFVSCELTCRPQLCGRPVVVGGRGDSGGIAAAMSNEAKALGVKRGTPIYQLKQLVDHHGLVVLPGNYPLYSRISAKVMSIVEQMGLQAEIYSIDEAFLHLPKLSSAAMVDLGAYLRKQVLELTGIPVSVGISHTKTLAKAAARFAKRYAGYHGVCAMDTTQKIERGLALTAIDDVWGIGSRLSESLKSKGITTAGQFAATPLQKIAEQYALPVQATWHELNGEKCISASSHTHRHLTSRCTRTFDHDITDRATLLTKMARFCDELGRDLRRHARLALEMEIFMTTNPYRTLAPQRTGTARILLSDATADTLTLTGAMRQGFDKAYLDGYGYKRAGVCITRTVGTNAHTESLFADHQMLRRRERLMDAVDNLTSVGLDIFSATAAI